MGLKLGNKVCCGAVAPYAARPDSRVRIGGSDAWDRSVDICVGKYAGVSVRMCPHKDMDTHISLSVLAYISGYGDTYICTRSHTHLHRYGYVYLRMYPPAYAGIYLWKDMSADIRTYACPSVDTEVRMSVCADGWIHTCMYVPPLFRRIRHSGLCAS